MADDGWRLGHRPGLDGLRGIAVLLVLALHWWPSVFPGGDTGVDLFFVLSGFLITRLIAEEVWRTDGFDLRAFYVRRVRRLMPASSALVLACLLTPGAIFVVLYSANWARISGELRGGPLEHTWSLAIEEQFYAVWPGVLVALLRFRRAWLPVLGVVAAVAAHRMAMDDGDWLRIVAGTDTRIDTILVGCAVALTAPMLLRFKRWPVAAAMVAVPLAALVFDPPWQLGLGFTVVAAGWAVVLLWAVESRGWICARSLRWFGRMSYSLYLWHYPVTWLLRDGDLHGGSPAVTALAIVGSFAAATLSHRLIEQRFRRSSGVGVGGVVVREDAGGAQGRGVQGAVVHGPVEPATAL